MTPQTLERSTTDAAQTPTSRVTKIFAPVALAAALAACGGNGSDVSAAETGDNGGDTPTTQPNTPPAQTVNVDVSSSKPIPVNGVLSLQTESVQVPFDQLGIPASIDPASLSVSLNAGGRVACTYDRINNILTITDNSTAAAEGTDATCVVSGSGTSFDANTNTTTNSEVHNSYAVNIDTKGPQLGQATVTFNGGIQGTPGSVTLTPDTFKATDIHGVAPLTITPEELAKHRGYSFDPATGTLSWAANALSGETIVVTVSDKVENPSSGKVTINLLDPTPVTPPTTPQCPPGTSYFDGVCS